MNQLRRRVDPTTDVAKWSYTKLFEHLQEYLGVGDFSGEPSEYRAWMMKQVGQMKRVMIRRRVSNEEMLMCARYCKAHRIQPESTAGLLYHIVPAKKWDMGRRKHDLDEHIAEAVDMEQERALSDEEASRWVDVLLRATGDKKEEVLAEWRRVRL